MSCQNHAYLEHFDSILPFPPLYRTCKSICIIVCTTMPSSAPTTFYNVFTLFFEVNTFTDSTWDNMTRQALNDFLLPCILFVVDDDSYLIEICIVRRRHYSFENFRMTGTFHGNKSVSFAIFSSTYM